MKGPEGLRLRQGCLLVVAAMLGVMLVLAWLSAPVQGSGYRLCTQHPAQQLMAGPAVHAAVTQAVSQAAATPKMATTLAVPSMRLGCDDLHPGLSKRSLITYHEPGLGVLVMDPGSAKIMEWITIDGGERKVHQVFRKLFREGCRVAGAAQLFVDVGSNAGFYSLLAAAYGCQVVLFDPQPSCISLVRSNMCLNQAIPAVKEGLVSIFNQPVSDVTTPIGMTLPRSCEGTFALPPNAKRRELKAAAAHTQKGLHRVAKPVSLDALFLDTGVPLYAVKVDTEGFELAVLRSMRGLMATGRVRHVLIEVTPLFWKRDGIKRVDVFDEFKPLLAMGCTMQRVLDVDLEAPSVTTSAPQHALATESDLYDYLVKRDFVQEDLLISSPEPRRA